MISLLRFLTGFTWLALCSVVYLVAAVLLLPWRVVRIKTSNLYGKVVGRVIVALAGVKPVVKNHQGLAGSMPAIYVSNHASTLDMFLCIWLCPFGGCGVFKKEVVWIPFFGQIALLSGHLLIDRSNRAKAVSSLETMARYVRSHRVGLWIMPEGTRSRNGRLQPFKKGFVHFAIATGLPVVPVILRGAHKNWKKGEFKFVPTTVEIDVLPPIDTSSWKEETAGEHAQQVHDLFAGSLGEDQRPLAA